MKNINTMKETFWKRKCVFWADEFNSSGYFDYFHNHYVRHQFKPIRLEKLSGELQSTISHERCFPAKCSAVVTRHGFSCFPTTGYSLSFSFSSNINKSNSLQSYSYRKQAILDTPVRLRISLKNEIHCHCSLTYMLS